MFIRDRTLQAMEEAARKLAEQTERMEEARQLWTAWDEARRAHVPPAPESVQ